MTVALPEPRAPRKRSVTTCMSPPVHDLRKCREQPASPINMNILGTPTDSVMLLP